MIRESDSLRELILALWRKTRLDWSHASANLSDGFRKNRQLGSDERRAAAETLYGMIRQLRRIDFALEQAGRLRDRDRDLARLWAYLVLDGLPPTDVPRAPALKLDIDWTKVTQVDEVIAKERKADIRLGLSASMPDWLARRFIDQWGERAEEICAALNERAPMTVRVNTLKTTAEALVTRLATEGFETSRGSLAENALTFVTRTNLFSLPSFAAGEFEAQDEGSQLIAELVAPPPKSKVVDYCAGAGGKTLALSAMMANRGRIVAADVAHRKLAELRRRAVRAGVDNVASATLPHDRRESLPKLLEAWRDGAARVLVDAPCTGVGALRRNPEIRWRMVEADFKRLPDVQSEILASARELVAPGGRLIYATCTLFSEENEHVVERFLESNPGWTIISPIEVWGRKRGEGMSDKTEQFMQLDPAKHGTDGFFAAVLRRPGS